MPCFFNGLTQQLLVAGVVPAARPRTKSRCVAVLSRRLRAGRGGGQHPDSLQAPVLLMPAPATDLRPSLANAPAQVFQPSDQGKDAHGENNALVLQTRFHVFRPSDPGDGAYDNPSLSLKRASCPSLAPLLHQRVPPAAPDLVLLLPARSS